MKEALNLALVVEEFDNNDESLPLELLKPIAATLRALAQPSDSVEQGPVYLIWSEDMEGWIHGDKKQYDLMPEEERWLLYTTPPQREWVGLNDEEIKILWIQYRAALPRFLCFARAVLSKSKEKNT